MRIIVNNFEAKKDMDEVVSQDFPRQENCEYCHSLIELKKEDTFIGEYGCVRWKCPCCGKNNSIYDADGEDLTFSYFHYPQHFSDNRDDCVRQTDEEIEDNIKALIKNIRRDKKCGIEDSIRYVATSDTLILVADYDDEYSVIVAKNYQDTYLKYEAEDYV